MADNGQAPLDLDAQQRSRWEKVLEHVKQEGLEYLFYCALVVGIFEAAEIVWDILTMMPAFAHFVGLRGPNMVVATSETSNVYLAFLAPYWGGSEWKKLQGLKGMDAVAIEELESRAKALSRGTVIVFAWQGLLILSMILSDLHVIARMPHEVFRVAMQSLGFWTGTFAFREVHKRNLRLKRSKDATAAESLLEGAAAFQTPEAQFQSAVKKVLRAGAQHRQMIIDFLNSNTWITRSEAEKITGLNEYQVTRLLTGMESSGRLLGEGTTRNRRYRLNDEGNPKRLPHELDKKEPENPKEPPSKPLE